MKHMPVHLSCLALLTLTLLGGTSCAPRATHLTLSDHERACLAYISKDPFMRIVRSERHANGSVYVYTRQGEMRLTYRIDPLPSSHTEPTLAAPTDTEPASTAATPTTFKPARSPVATSVHLVPQHLRISTASHH